MRLFCDPKYHLADDRGILTGRFAFASDAERARAVALAEEAAKEPIPPLYATTYLRFLRDGNRSDYDNAYHVRRKNLIRLFLGVLAGEDRFVDPLVDMLWAIMEETSWVVPAHNVSVPYKQYGEPLPNVWEGDRPEVDLFSAETGGIFAFIYLYAAEKLDAVTPVIRERMKDQVRRRVLRPYTDRNMRWSRNWMNNWTPWITSNVLPAAAVFAEDDFRLSGIVDRALLLLDRFTDTYGEDGGCNEGPSYWRNAVGALFDCAENLYDLTGGDIDVFSHPLLFGMCEYFADMCIDPDARLFVNFADCPPKITPDPKFLARMARRTESQKLAAFAAASAHHDSEIMYYNISRIMRSLTEPQPDFRPLGGIDTTGFYPDLGVATMRRGEWFFAAKGGHNDESHNHNDVGTILLYHGTDPVFLDPGVGTYCKATFDKDLRYTIFSMQSAYHNLPTVGGVMEREGAEYRADAFSSDGDTVTVSYAGAFPREAGVRAAHRTATLSATGLTLTDKVNADAPAVFSFMLRAEPERISENVLSVAGCRVAFSGGEVTVERVDDGGDHAIAENFATGALYRVLVKTDGTLVTEVTKE